ncbi:MAG TPA: 50S ribosomal protein L17 [Verrucomicrobiae bacterium]|nr:50S ribosomal protein L17 [Verrucomicrobiae bacterium]
MRHLKKTAKLGRTGEHRNAMLANMVCSLIKHKRIETTLAKAKAVRPVAEKVLTLGKENTLHARRLVAAKLRQQPRSHFAGTPKTKGKVARDEWRKNEDVIRILFEDLAPAFKDRNGGYTRIIKLGQRQGDAGDKAIIEWVDFTPAAPVAPATTAPAGGAAPTEEKK